MQIMIAIVGMFGLIISGFVVLAITPILYAQVPSSSDIAKMVLDETTNLWACGDNPSCKHASEQALATIELYQKQDAARGTTQTFGIVLIVLPIVVGIIALAKS